MRSGRWGSVLLCLALFAGGCSGDAEPSATPTVVDGKAAEAKRKEQERAFAACMREHGVPLADDPSQQKVGEIKADDTYIAAYQSCGSLQPKQTLNPQEAVENLEHRRKNAQCMRENGFPDWPDPDPMVDADQPPPGVDLDKAKETLTMCSRKNS
ncbi:hypothetical protein [Dactylosporangium fulvum]|uniref:Lipoprotein n=1 Tax=Dactylosporangium fulvum TaxID=53359 RepID=A0ABY5W7T3_9ACTN|nr:hypothetical protein [Dactylosporangium fulvum]UWP85602.1 hypothetical protein Dfulv_15695 [Dactylosporangium fulvum]